MDPGNDKLSIKNLLFTKAIPNYILPVPVDGHKVFACMDCGDKFILGSSLEQHINRKSLKISYTCQNNNCRSLKIFYNRCNLLAHIRSHNFKTATITVNDLKVEPLPISEINTTETLTNNNSQIITDKPSLKKKDTSYCCPICSFSLPTTSALKSHLRIHLECPPYICTECGTSLSSELGSYLFDHSCEGFRKMKASTRVQCPVPDCYIVHCHPSFLNNHIKRTHLKKVFKCPYCFVACFSEPIIAKHMTAHEGSCDPFIFYQCEMCPGRLVLQDTLDNHLKGHETSERVFPCWECGTSFPDAASLLKHHTLIHDTNKLVTRLYIDLLKDVSESGGCNTNKKKKIYRVVKKCDLCKSSFKYRCSFEQINMLPNECPARCNSAKTASESEYEQIVCGMCKNKMKLNWEDIKTHFSAYHKKHRCLDLNIVLRRLDLKKERNAKPKKHIITKQKPIQKNCVKTAACSIIDSDLSADSVVQEAGSTRFSNEYRCVKCDQRYNVKKEFEAHIITHKDPCMAYQCMECGQCFVVKPTFSKHLLLEHDITDTEDYISCHTNCYNEIALMRYQSNVATSNQPLCENQCKICRQQFDNAGELEKHFRVHGMAFLIENRVKNTSP